MLAKLDYAPAVSEGELCGNVKRYTLSGIAPFWAKGKSHIRGIFGYSEERDAWRCFRFDRMHELRIPSDMADELDPELRDALNAVAAVAVYND